ncbi:hypothetical protein COV19_05095 [Candidatus Woesearchaeota archaeon CG10_big_fil_rev_8_21_14_0_10_44_13]|nr:MAG: hypothetical protein COV19_05095 [Candidatus Woesearchaeota archaeon CG10_big_fil_rev_8_21_14_0_10_44_13]
MQKIKLLKIWYGLVILILVSLLYEHTTKFEFTSIVFWLRLVLLLVALLLTFYVISDVFIPVRAAKRVENVFVKEIKRKNSEINRLRREKEMFARSALKEAEKNVEMSRSRKE